MFVRRQAAKKTKKKNNEKKVLGAQSKYFTRCYLFDGSQNKERVFALHQFSSPCKLLHSSFIEFDIVCIV